MSLQLNQMTTKDKIRTMESLWDDLCRHANAVASPSWHKGVLSQREKSLVKGKDKFIDWNKEKGRIRKYLK